MWSAHGLVLPLLLATDVDLVALHGSIELTLTVLGVERAYFVQHMPRSLLRDLYVTGQLKGGYTLLVGGYQVHRQEPLAKRKLGVLEDGPSDAGEVMVTGWTAETTVRTTYAVVLAAIRANDIIAPASLGEGLLTSLFVNEVICYCYERVELCEIYHGKNVFGISITLKK